MEKVICRVGFMIHNFPGVKTFAIRGDLKIVILFTTKSKTLWSTSHFKKLCQELGGGEGLKGMAELECQKSKGQ